MHARADGGGGEGWGGLTGSVCVRDGLRSYSSLLLSISSVCGCAVLALALEPARVRRGRADDRSLPLLLGQSMLSVASGE